MRKVESESIRCGAVHSSGCLSGASSISYEYSAFSSLFFLRNLFLRCALHVPGMYVRPLSFFLYGTRHTCFIRVRRTCEFMHIGRNLGNLEILETSDLLGMFVGVFFNRKLPVKNNPWQLLGSCGYSKNARTSVATAVPVKDIPSGSFLYTVL